MTTSPRAKSKPAFRAGGLAEISAQADNVDAAVVLVNIGKDTVGIVFAAIIDEDHLVGLADGVHDFRDLHVQRGDVFLLVIERNNDGIVDGCIASHTPYSSPF